MTWFKSGMKAIKQEIRSLHQNLPQTSSRRSFNPLKTSISTFPQYISSSFSRTKGSSSGITAGEAWTCFGFLLSLCHIEANWAATFIGQIYRSNQVKFCSGIMQIITGLIRPIRKEICRQWSITDETSWGFCGYLPPTFADLFDFFGPVRTTSCQSKLRTWLSVSDFEHQTNLFPVRFSLVPSQGALIWCREYEETFVSCDTSDHWRSRLTATNSRANRSFLAYHQKGRS